MFVKTFKNQSVFFDHMKQAAVALFIRNDGKILLQHRDNNTTWFPDHWSFFGGGIEEGEKPIDTIKRELVEELEYAVVNPKLVHIHHFFVDGEECVNNIFLIKYDETSKLKLHEGKEYGWFSYDDLKALKMLPDDKSALRYMKKKELF